MRRTSDDLRQPWEPLAGLPGPGPHRYDDHVGRNDLTADLDAGDLAVVNDDVLNRSYDDGRASRLLGGVDERV